MSHTPLTQYAAYLLGVVKSSGRNAAWLNRLEDPGQWINDAAMAGTVVVPKVTAFTAQSLTDGTLQTNQLNNTTASLTFYDRTVPISMKPSVARALDFTSGANLAAIADKAGDALRQVVTSQIIADLVAATPGDSATLTAGKAEFAGAGQTELAYLDRAIAYVVGASTADPGDLTILVSRKALGNLFAARNALVGFTQLGMDANGMLNYGGIPIFPVTSTTTNWSGASNACAYVLHRSAYYLSLRDAYPHDPERFWIPEGDGMYKHLINATWCGGVVEANLFAEIVSNTS